jgi:hypothetical protein
MKIIAASTYGQLLDNVGKYLGIHHCFLVLECDDGYFYLLELSRTDADKSTHKSGSGPINIRSVFALSSCLHN